MSCITKLLFNTMLETRVLIINVLSPCLVSLVSNIVHIPTIVGTMLETREDIKNGKIRANDAMRKMRHITKKVITQVGLLTQN